MEGCLTCPIFPYISSQLRPPLKLLPPKNSQPNQAKAKKQHGRWFGDGTDRLRYTTVVKWHGHCAPNPYKNT